MSTASFEPSITSPTNSTGSSSPTKRSLSDRINRTRRHRQWIAHTAPTASSTGSAASESALTQERIRSKIAKAAENYQKHRKAHQSSPSAASPSRAGTGNSHVKPQQPQSWNTSAANFKGAGKTESSAPSYTEQKTDAPEPAEGSRNGYYMADASGPVAWPDQTYDPDEPPALPVVPTATFQSPAKVKTWQKKSLSEQKPAPWSKDSLRRSTPTSASDTVSPESVVSEPVRPSWQRGSVTKRYAPWEKRQEEEDENESINITPRKLAPWEKQNHAKSEPEPHVEEPAPSAVDRYAPGAGLASRPDAKSPARPRISGKLAPWEKPPHEEGDLLEIKRCGSWHSTKSESAASKWRTSTPTYEIGRQGAWQKPHSPPRPTQSQETNATRGRETVADKWMRREPEVTASAPSVDGTAPESNAEPKKLAPWQLELQNRKSQTQSAQTQSKREATTGDDNRAVSAPEAPKPRKVEPSWMKSTGPQQQPNLTRAQPHPTKKTPWMQKQSIPSVAQKQTKPSMVQKQTISSVARRYQTPDRYANGSEIAGEAEKTVEQEPEVESGRVTPTTPRSTAGRAVIETPESRSVASLRASLGSKPAPPPLPGGPPPAVAAKSPGNSPWLAGNRKTANRIGSPYLGGRGSPVQTGQGNEGNRFSDIDITKVSFDKPAAFDDSAEKAPTPIRSHVKRGLEENRVASESAPAVSSSPLKSLADLAADSVMITDYSQLNYRGKPDEFLDDDESMLSSGVGANTPSQAELPIQFQDITSKKSIESNTSTIANDVSPNSLALTSEDVERRNHLRHRVETYDSNHSSPSQIPKLKPSPSDDRSPRRRKSKSPARTHPSEASAEVLSRIRQISNEHEPSEAGSSSAVFGDPSTYGAAGGDEQGFAPAVPERARAIEDWNGGKSGMPKESPSRGMDPDGASARDPSFPLNQMEQPVAQPKAQVGQSHPSRSGRGASRVLSFFGNQEPEDTISRAEQRLWASRDPDVDIIVRDQSPSPEPSETPSQRPINGSKGAGNSLKFASNAPSATRTPERNSNLDLDPNDVFGTSFFSSNAQADGSVNQTFDFDETDASFFSSTSDDKFNNESPFRVVLQPPRESPANRVRRQLEASRDFDSHYAQYYAANAADWDNDPRSDI